LRGRNAVSPFAEAGNIFLPHPAIVPWVDAYLDELCAFPNGRYDDQVDQTTQALIRIKTREPEPPMSPCPPWSPPSEYSWME